MAHCRLTIVGDSKPSFGTFLASPLFVVRAILPTRALAVLLAIGFFDLIATVWLHAQGKIEELNPVMAPLLAGGEWPFAAVKTATLLFAWVLLAKQAKKAPQEVRQACLFGSAAYLALLGSAFFGFRL